MSTLVPIPKLGQSEETVKIEKWRVKEGDKIKPGGLGHADGHIGSDDTLVVAGGIDQLNLAGADFLVDARATFFGGQRGFLRTTNG